MHQDEIMGVVQTETDKRLDLLDAATELWNATFPKRDITNISFVEMPNTGGRNFVSRMYTQYGLARERVLIEQEVEPQRVTVGFIFGDDPYHPHTWAGTQEYVYEKMADFCRKRWDEVYDPFTHHHTNYDDYDAFNNFCGEHGVYRWNSYELPLGT